MNHCSILVKTGKKKPAPLKKGCPKEAKYWLQMGLLGTIPDQQTPCIWLCEYHARKVHNWGFKE